MQFGCFLQTFDAIGVFFSAFVRCISRFSSYHWTKLAFLTQFFHKIHIFLILCQKYAILSTHFSQTSYLFPRLFYEICLFLCRPLTKFPFFSTIICHLSFRNILKKFLFFQWLFDRIRVWFFILSRNLYFSAFLKNYIRDFFRGPFYKIHSLLRSLDEI